MFHCYFISTNNYYIYFLKKNNIPYLGLHNAQDFAQILYFVGVVRIINRNNVFHSFPDQEITCLTSYENTNKTQHI